MLKHLYLIVITITSVLFLCELFVPNLGPTNSLSRLVQFRSLNGSSFVIQFQQDHHNKNLSGIQRIESIQLGYIVISFKLEIKCLISELLFNHHGVFLNDLSYKNNKPLE